eukprot:GHVU01233027.1.p2 GENE.GHVU01233027.1~~GHVU01233027.1.p2  ORF type:complete len:116 (+),score=3.88 GHVU01233027.1:270-617(+)
MPLRHPGAQYYGRITYACGPQPGSTGVCKLQPVLPATSMKVDWSDPASSDCGRGSQDGVSPENQSAMIPPFKGTRMPAFEDGFCLAKPRRESETGAIAPHSGLSYIHGRRRAHMT